MKLKVKGHSDFKVKCLTFGLYTQVSDLGPHGPLVKNVSAKLKIIFRTQDLKGRQCICKFR